MISLGSLYQFLRADWASLEQIWPVLKSRFDQFGQLVSKREDVSFSFLDERRFLAEILGLDVALEGGEGDLGLGDLGLGDLLISTGDWFDACSRVESFNDSISVSFADARLFVVSS